MQWSQVTIRSYPLKSKDALAVHCEQGMVAVAAESSARLLFFKLVHDPSLLARLLVLYFEKNSAADPIHGIMGSSDREKQEGRDEGDAKDTGSPVRLSQVRDGGGEEKGSIRDWFHWVIMIANDRSRR